MKRLSTLSLSLLSLAVLTACPVQDNETATPLATTSITADVQRLLAQKNIDPITRYIEAHSSDTDHPQVIKQLRDEREKRCRQIAKVYAEREKNMNNLNRLQQAYQYSCPQLVANFARTVATTTLATPATQTLSPGEACHQHYAQADYAAARQQCRIRAKQGDPQAQLKLGILYADGRGGAKDQQEAYVWFSLAVQGGIEQAQVLRHSIAKSLSTEALVAANDRVVKLSAQFP